MASENSAQSLDIRVEQTKTEQFINKHKKKLIGGFIAILVLVSGFFGGRYWLNQREDKASAQLALGTTYVQQIMQTHPDSVATLKTLCNTALKGDGKKKDGFVGFLAISKDYKWTDAANLAHLYAGICYYQTKDYKNAIEELKNYSDKDDVTVSANAHKVLGDCYAANKQVDEAIKEYKKAAEKADSPALSPMYLMNAAALYEESGKKAEANKIYVEIKEKYPSHPLCQPSVQGEMVEGPQIEKYIESTK